MSPLPPIVWSAAYHPAWDAQPQAYVTAAIVAWGRSRRLGRAADPQRAFKAYLGVQHSDPARWGLAGLAQARFFVSLFVAGRTVALHTHPTMTAALGELADFYARLSNRP